ncbi:MULTISPECIES: terminase large subunit [Glaesserella]|uniref:Terminase n=1 Tax=Glaesserella australis TaxID=2094024 RepID=A0A328BXV5_9PAST|nr:MULTISPECIES: terminase TerL endonuclease subunit [Glaesserella]AUI65617.1 terminase [Glaesserella sp. 15-184]RAL19096.1 terminase [Glaesserella australis]
MMNNVEKANKYAQDVVSGKIAACRYIKKACQRHLDDLEKQQDLAFPYHFDNEKAEKACKFIQYLPHTKGEWAMRRQSITLEAWQLFIIANAFGWLRKSNNLRKYRQVYTEIPRKNGKSAISAGVGLYMFCMDNEFGAEIYSGATTEKQAWEVFRPARLMCKNTDLLRQTFGIEVNASNLNRPADGSRFEPLIGTPGDGQSPSCAIVDEYHEHKDDELYTTMLTGMGARKQPLMWIITTAGYNIEGPCYDKRREVIDMLNGTTPNDELFGMIYTIDEDDDWTDPVILRKANPNFDISVYGDYLESQQKQAINNPRFTNKFKTKHLNVWVSAKESFFNMVSWENCRDDSLTLDDFAGEDVVLGLDMARKLDMNSLVPVFTRIIDGKRHYYCIAPKFFVPEDTIFSTDTALKRVVDKYQKWVVSGHLTATDGAEVDYREILESIKDTNKEHKVVACPIDPHGAIAISHDLADEGLNPITITQNYTNLSDPMKELEAAIEAGRFHHDGNPIMTWCIGNVVGKYTAGNDDIVRPVKEIPENKIDGAVGLMMAIGRLMLNDDDGYMPDEILTL